MAERLIWLSAAAAAGFILGALTPVLRGNEPPVPPTVVEGFECRRVDYAMQFGGEDAVQITSACLRPEVWAYYDAQGISSDAAITLASEAYLDGKEPWRWQVSDEANVL